MTTLLSSISGQFGKAILLGTLFPVLIVSILNDLITVPLLPSGPALQKQLSRIAVGEDKWAAIVLIFVVVVVSGFLYNLNIPIIRLYEGYPWKRSYLGWLWMWRKKRTWRRMGPLRLSLRHLRRQLAASNAPSTVTRPLQSAQNDLAGYINAEMPDKEDFVLPTRFGNVIRCFERYSDVAYGMDAIVFWPRLVAKIEPAFAVTIDEAKTSVDFMVNSSLLCAISGLAVGFIGLFTHSPWSVAAVLGWGWRLSLFFVLAIVSYASAINRARAWGGQVKSAFDLYRFDLLKALGYKQQPSTYFEEKTLWHRISVQLLFADSREQPIPYQVEPTRMSASPPGIVLEMDRNVTNAIVAGTLVVQITIKNKDRKPANSVVLMEALPDGYRFVPGSASVSAGVLTVIDISPPRIRVGEIAPNETLTVTYTMKSAAA
ncbi:MAG TPA: hypothetical protein VE377_06770 [Candidatus Dormibacteraeota bacterium]|nr:hypothetical protein [Candidatus Dormibacteraeota bacterium]